MGGTTRDRCALVVLSAVLALAGRASAQAPPEASAAEMPAAEPAPSAACEDRGPIDPGELYRRLRASFVVLRCSGERYGTGFGFGHLGRIATARHVVTCPRGLAAELSDGTIANVRVVAMDEEHDIALVELAGAASTRVPPLLPEREPATVGTEVISVGFPVGPEGSGPYELAVTRGIVAERTENRIVHDALVSPGSSGGPVIDREGRVVGVTFAIPRDSSVGLAVPVEHLTMLHRETPREAGDPRDPFRFGFDIGLSYELVGPNPFHFGGVQLALWATAFDQIVATLRAIALVRFPQTLPDGGIELGGNRFAAEADLGYRLRIDGFPLLFELAGGFSIGNDHVSQTHQELMLADPSCDPAVMRCAVRTFAVQREIDQVLSRPLATLRVMYGPLTLEYTVLFDVEHIEQTAHRVTLRLGIF